MSSVSTSSGGSFARQIDPACQCRAALLRKLPRKLSTTRLVASRLLPSLLLVWMVLAATSLSRAQQPPAVSTRVSTHADGSIEAVSTVAAGAHYHPSRLLVKFRNGNRGFLPGSANARGFAHDSDVFLVDTPPGLSVAAAVAQYRNNPNVVYAEPDYVVQIDATTPNDTRWAEQWDMAKIAAPSAWDTQTSAANVVVAVIDTGINETHPDLAANVLPGWNCINAAANVPVGCKLVQLDDHGHGTHVAGTIGAVGNNNTGVTGVNWIARIMAFKFLGAGGSGNTSDAMYAFNRVGELKASGAPNTNIRLTNNSWGGGGFSQALKDAMAAVEALGIVNVCAAGNDGVNADITPMYPAAYDNRGIVSVLASDGNDLGAGFTNFGMAGVDIAAPGVSILSTSPTGTCSLCDPAFPGYRYLSGTSMASPHVAGAVAAMLHKNSTLGAFMTRDVLLDPASYDTLSDAKAKTTSSGGRLNLFKLLGNPKLMNPPAQLNSFPAVTIGGNIFVSAGQLATLSATFSDTDDAQASLRSSWGKSSSASAWLFGNVLNTLFPAPSGNPSSFTAPALGRTASVPYLASVSDNRGGGASAAQVVTVSPLASTLGGPDGSFSVSPLNVARVNGSATVTVNYSPSDPDNKGTPLWDVWHTGSGGSSGNCCFSGASTTRTFTSAGVYRVSVNSIDRYLEGSSLTTAGRRTAVVSVDGAAGTPPLATASLTPASGPVPLTVTVSMTGSQAFEGKTIQNYFISCGEGFVAGGSGSTRQCTFNNPGAYWLLEQVQDSAGMMDLVSLYVVATPVNSGGGGGGADLTPPSVNITSPGVGASVSGAISLIADATDAGGSGMKEVKFYLDSTANAPLGTVSGAGPTFTLNNWNSASVSNGSHTLFAIASDNAGNGTTSAGVGVTVNNSVASPTISLGFSPFPAKKASVTITATVTTGAPSISKVDFYINNVLVGTDSSPSGGFTYAWKVPAAPNRTYNVHGIVTDSLGRTLQSSTSTFNP